MRGVAGGGGTGKDRQVRGLRGTCIRPPCAEVDFAAEWKTTPLIGSVNQIT